MHIPMDWVSQIISKAQQHFGVSYPADQQRDVLRRLQWRAEELQIHDVKAWLHLAATQPWDLSLQQQLLSAFTVGETYFCRDPKVNQWLTERWLPTQPAGATLQIWSAGCCSGEEAYSVLFQLSEALAGQPAPAEIVIHATDLNPDFISKARLGVYGGASFRNCPPEFQSHYFDKISPTQWQVKFQWRSAIRFSVYNLLQTPLPFSNPFDLILCRNVLMYFAPEQACQIIRRLQQQLQPQGLLLVGAVEASLASQICDGGFWAADNFALPAPDLKASAQCPPPQPPAPVDIRHHKSSALRHCLPPAFRHRAADPAPSVPPAPAPAPKQQLWLQLQQARAQGQMALAQQLAASYFDTGQLSATEQQQFYLLQARLCADLQQLSQARVWLSQWLASAPDIAAGYLFSAQLYAQQQQYQAALSDLHKALYLEPDLVIAHLLRAQLLLQTGKQNAASKALQLCNQLLQPQPPELEVPCSDGISVRQLHLLCQQLSQEISACLPR